jgi:hypothetical protein
MKRTQFGWVFLAVIIAILAFVSYQKQDTSTIIVLVAFSTILLFLFYKLTIKVTNEYVKFSLGIGLISGKYKLKSISHCKSLSYIPFGWGIRLRPGIILFNVSGTKAIELEIKNKNRKVWIGTNCPEEIADYINSKKNKV